MNTSPPIARERSAFRHPPFRWYFGGAAISFLGTWFERVALGWYTWELTQSVFWTGFVAMALTLPTGLLGPFIGVYVDRWNARVISIVLNVLMCAAAIGFFVLSMRPDTTIVPIAILSVLLGIVGAWYHPVRLLLVSEVVPRQYLTSGIGLVAVAFNASRMIGPAVAGVIIHSLGLPLAFFLNAVSYLPMIIIIALIPLTRRPKQVHGGKLIAELREGFMQAAHHRLIRWCLLTVLTSAIVSRGLLEILPAVAGNILAGGSGELAVLTSAAGAGALVASILVGVMSPTIGRMQSWSRWLLTPSMVFSMAMALGIGLWPLAGFMVFIGFATTMISISAQSIVQLSAPDQFRARLLTWWSTANFGGSTIGALLLGYFGDLLPLAMTIAVLGAIGLAVSLVLTARSPAPETGAASP